MSLYPELEVFDQLPVSFWMSGGADRNYEIAYWNRGAVDIYGFSKSDALGVSFIDLFVDEPARAQAMRDADAVIAGGFQHPINCLAIDNARDGSQIILLTNVFRYEAGGDVFQAEIAVNLTPSGFVRFLDDDYLEKRTGPDHAVQRTLEAFITHTHNVIERKRDLWARTFAHEIRSEVSSIKHALDRLAEARPKLRDIPYFKDIERAHRGLYLLSQNFLYSQGGLGGSSGSARPSEHEGFRLGKHLVETLDEYAYSASLRGLKLALDPAPGVDACVLRGSVDAFTNALRNLLDNSIKHYDDEITRGDGSLSADDGHDIHIVAVVTADHELSVKITNPGQLPEDEGRNKFAPYHKASESPAEGLHLGLSITKQWVDQVGGRLALENVDEGHVSAELVWPLARKMGD